MLNEGITPALSAQERAIVDGKKVLHGTATDRGLRMSEAIRTSGPPRVALERAVYFTESFKATEGQPLVLRWAKALKHIAENMSVAILADELIVGRPCTWFGRYSLVYPELDGTIIQEGAKAFIEAKKAGAPDAVTVTDEDKKIIDEVLFPYWNVKDFAPNFVKALPPESRAMNFGRDHELVVEQFGRAFAVPFLLNNSVGKFNSNPSVAGRMDSFNDAIEKMLWPEKRDKDPILGDKVPGFIYRTTETSYIKIAPGFISPLLEKMLSWGGWLNRWLPWLFSEEGIEIGPIPKGTPVNLLTNIDLDSGKLDLAKLLLKLKAALKAVEGKSESEAAVVFKGLVPDLLKVSKCPDFVVNKGHYFGTAMSKEGPALSDEDKRALIEFLKTF